MRLGVRHATLYHFDVPARFVTQSLRLTPASSASQQVLEWELSARGALFGAGFVDGAGDRVTTMTVQGPTEAIEILVEGLVATADTAGVLRDHKETIAPRVYLRATQMTQPNRALLDLMGRALGAGDGDALAQAHRLAAAVADAIAYEPGTTHAHTSAAEALEQGRGVCQDHAHALIAVAHAAGLPARYVTGYLQTRSDGSDEEASHAWAEVHVAGLGWVGFDPANRCCPDERYIRLGSGRDAREAAPIRGVQRGGGAGSMDVALTVAAQQ
jgi:transglutaminase-like putative cysteine protease